MGAHLRNTLRPSTSRDTRGNGVELMPVHRRKYISGKTVWFYRFNATGSTRDNRREFRAFGFETKQAAVDAEANRRIEEQQKSDLVKAGAAGVAAAVPTTLGLLL